MATAFFDLDLTVLSVNSGSLWVRSELRDGFITRTQALKGAWMILQYQLGRGAMEHAILEAIGSLKGQREAEVRARTEAFYRRELRDLFRPGALARIDAHRARGDRVVLLTSSSNYLSGLVQQELGLDGILCNRFEVDEQGLFTGKPADRLCFGVGKVEHARRYLADRPEALQDCAFYTDSNSDLPALEAFGTPVAVNPDPRLKRAAKARGWAIEDWGA